MITTSQPESRLQMGGVVVVYLAALFITVARQHSHAFHSSWNVIIPLGLSMACLVYALFRPTNTGMGISAIVSAATLFYLWPSDSRGNTSLRCSRN
jgi:hypothetical protein